MKGWQRRTLGYLIRIGLTALYISLPFWNPVEMSVGDKLAWWVVFGVAMVYVWVQWLAYKEEITYGSSPRRS